MSILYLNLSVVIILLIRINAATSPYSLALNKRRVIVKSGEIFLNPCLLYEELKSGRTASKQRYTTKVSKADVAAVVYRHVTVVVYRPMSLLLFTDMSLLLFTYICHCCCLQTCHCCCLQTYLAAVIYRHASAVVCTQTALLLFTSLLLI